jgi:hypothetical protein
VVAVGDDHSMSAELASSPVVRGLRVVRTSEYRRQPFWKSVLALGLSLLDIPAPDDHVRSVLSVRSGPDVLARRGCKNDTVADLVRNRFIARVTSMTSREFEHADWQAVLDATPEQEAERRPRRDRRNTATRDQ